MTLIVGIKCSDGVVVAADGAATLGSFGQQTVRQPVKKLSFIGDDAILAVSGAVGLAQRIEATLRELHEQKAFQQKKPYQAISMLRSEFWNQHLQQEIQVAAIAKNTIGQSALAAAVCQTVIAVPLKGEPFLIQFDSQGAPEYASESLPFIAIGNGQSIADPFLAFLRRVFWRTKMPTLGEGVFAAVWTLHHAVAYTQAASRNPKQIAVLEKVNSSWKAREFDVDELQEHEQFAQAAEEYVSAFRAESTPRPETETEPPPPMPPRT